MTARKFSTAQVRPALHQLVERKNDMFEKSLRTLKLIALLTLGFCAVTGSTPAHAAAPTPPVPSRASAISTKLNSNPALGGTVFINACGPISSPGNFVLTKNLTASGDCLTLTSSNINIDMNGHSISGDGTGNGIVGNNLKSIVINDGTIKHFATGIKLTISSACCIGSETIQNMNVSNNTSGGILIDGCCNTFANITANSNGGIGLRNNDCCSTVTNVVTNGNGGDGMHLIDCCYVVEHSTANGNGGDGIFTDGCCSAVNDTLASNNHADGLDVEGCCSTVVSDVTSGNGNDGVFFSGCCGDNRGNNIAVNSKANGNAANGFEFTDLRNSITNVVANKNTAHGVFMTCPATETGIAAKGNGSSNLDEDTSSGACTAINNKAP
jgi:hypothetical protein